jgi:ABC-type antimicrobial peptide transport system permease subunit
MDIDDALKLRLESWKPANLYKERNYVVGNVIINQSLARQLWPGESEGNAVGKIIYFSDAHEIIGVVRDFHLVSHNKDFVPGIYRPEGNDKARLQTFLVKLHSAALMKDFRQRLSNLDMGAVSIEVLTLGEIVSESMANMRMTLQLLGCFAFLGILVAGLSVYATTSLMAAARNHETGIRMALGATTLDILRLTLWRSIRIILFALPVGLFLAWILSQVLSSFLFQVKVGDPLAWVISCALLLVITTVAALIPALRAARVNPLDALRNE